MREEEVFDVPGLVLRDLQWHRIAMHPSVYSSCHLRLDVPPMAYAHFVPQPLYQVWDTSVIECQIVP